MLLKVRVPAPFFIKPPLPPPPNTPLIVVFPLPTTVSRFTPLETFPLMVSVLAELLVQTCAMLPELTAALIVTAPAVPATEMPLRPGVSVLGPLPLSIKTVPVLLKVNPSTE